ncbi:FtsW/RodA/SpoVE family cell cycle protein [Frankia sp. CNm7]|uniref:FtsW/RodA/SpoVE family cell cycle protein n=1 Tax=Frankia nepalensis TaxID=1836974 RepID=A0A937RA24_9ACTN|nr:FtsW/RodA/SpoVE family cell cycle protein [Frankia nepalensis]MBL7494893.1 FtsW/RodA/SpoVE family cell cycle protein [Frankia nepalensis]MBL7515646.1 FtsW/RodA/SpoVE family cell cycle protein [Frankia nepalensis]MBL7521184.1 FtsW/RodA/SpoVE family cell cycle protein [Frankia nepalensis]MBL7626660.1 FtsW/RodA/SpoVE family cell cycle protein [Frankia nepalensis]
MTLPPLRRPRPADLTATFAGFPLPAGLDIPPYRRRELVLLVFAGLLATGALAALMLAHDGKLTFQIATYGLGFFALWGVAHLAVRWFAPAADPLLLPLTAALNGIGLVMIYRIDLARSDAQRKAGEDVTVGAAQTQLVWTLLAIIVFVLVLAVMRDHTTLTRYTYTAGLAGIVLLLLPVVPGIGATINGARLWLRVGPFSFQPSEVSKILLAIFFAGYLGRMRDVISVASPTVLGLKLPRPRDLGPVVVAWAASLGVLIVEKDLGSSLLLFAMFLVILYTATEQVSWVLVGLGLFCGGAMLAYQLFDHVQVRVDGWLHAFQGTNPTSTSYQLVQGLYGFAAGGVLGTGIGQGNPTKVPFSNTDFIMASLGEELGLTGVMAILVMYMLIVMRGLRAAVAARDPFGKLLATGLSATIAFQVFVQVGGVMRLIPLTGLTLPFMSYGGSSIVANAAIIAILLRISDTTTRDKREKADPAPLFDPGAVAGAETQVVVKAT